MSQLKHYAKKIPLYLLMLLLVWMAIIILMPKKSLWYEVEAVMVKQKLVVHGEKLYDALFHLNVSEAELYFGAMNLARVESVDILPLGIYNTLQLKNLFVGAQIPIVKGLHIKKADISYIPFGNLNIGATGNFGTLVGFIDLTKRNIELKINASNWLKKQTTIMQKLRKKDKGYYFAWHY